MEHLLIRDLVNHVEYQRERLAFWKEHKDARRSKRWRKRAKQDLKRAKKQLAQFLKLIFPLA